MSIFYKIFHKILTCDIVAIMSTCTKSISTLMSLA